MKKYTILLLTVFMILLTASLNAKTLHDFQATTIDGEILDFSSFKGKRLLIVNTASKCGYTYQYGDLQKLFDKYGGDKFMIIGFPANNFAGQEPGSDEDIKDFCEENYGVTFQMMSKISVTGNDMHEIYKWLTQKSENGVRDAPIQWNFQKFMIDENGNWVDVVMPQVSPLINKITEWLESFTTDIENEIGMDQQSYSYPNPFSQSTTITYHLQEPAVVEIKIYDALGIEIAIPVNEFMISGEHKTVIEGGNLNPGVYYYTINTGNMVRTGNIMLIK